ncbi:MAG TPA: cyclic nucleotide-binding domain-containing protein, partial [Candidatus Saccharimonadales bacterium]|nr:cyclic nucleotide-binding domain-containing protein [Candidatus Saccharimonadales bacterium]
MQELPPTLREMIEGVRPKHFPRGQILLHQGDILHDVLVLTDGVIKLHDIDGQGNEKILHLVRPYSIVPWVFFSGKQGSMQWFYSALTDCDVCVLPADELARRMKQ